MSAHPVRTASQMIATVAGPLAAIGLAWALTLGDPTDDGGLSAANAALVMALLVVTVAHVDWLAGIVTSVTAALALNYFHTQPLLTLRVTDSRDVVSIVLLGALGVLVSATTAARVRRGVTRVRAGDASAAGRAFSTAITEDHPAGELWSAAIAAPGNDLALVLARVDRAAPIALPVIGRTSDSKGVDDTLVLPAYGAALRLERRHAEGRWLVLTPRTGIGPLTLDRRAVMAFATTVELGLDPTGDAPERATTAS
jgi:hypothetical protein